jgi:hypothetical protein
MRTRFVASYRPRCMYPSHLCTHGRWDAHVRIAVTRHNLAWPALPYALVQGTSLLCLLFSPRRAYVQELAFRGLVHYRKHATGSKS